MLTHVEPVHPGGRYHSRSDSPVRDTSEGALPFETMSVIARVTLVAAAWMLGILLVPMNAQSQDAPTTVVAQSGQCRDAGGTVRYTQIRLVHYPSLGYRLRATPTDEARRAAVGDPDGAFAALVTCAPSHPAAARILRSQTGRQQFDCHAWFSVFQFRGVWLGGPTWDLEGWKPARLHPILWWLTRCN